MDQVIRASIPIRIKNAFKPDGHGTVIIPNSCEPTKLQKILSSSQLSTSPSANTTTFPHRARIATAVTIKDNVTVVNIRSNKKSVSHGFFASIFTTLDKFGIVVDLISTSEVHVSMALGPNVLNRKLDEAVAELRIYGMVRLFLYFAIF
jgi:aspartate kinase